MFWEIVFNLQSDSSCSLHLSQAGGFWRPMEAKGQKILENADLVWLTKANTSRPCEPFSSILICLYHVLICTYSVPPFYPLARNIARHLGPRKDRDETKDLKLLKACTEFRPMGPCRSLPGFHPSVFFG